MEGQGEIEKGTERGKAGRKERQKEGEAKDRGGKEENTVCEEKKVERREEKREK